jgi:HTH-type transcriptional regulator / antitoxin HigA
MVEGIRCAADYEAALKEIEGLMTAEAGTCEGGRLAVLVDLVQSWERRQGGMEYGADITALSTCEGVAKG